MSSHRGLCFCGDSTHFKDSSVVLFVCHGIGIDSTQHCTENLVSLSRRHHIQYQDHSDARESSITYRYTRPCFEICCSKKPSISKSKNTLTPHSFPVRSPISKHTANRKVRHVTVFVREIGYILTMLAVQEAEAKEDVEMGGIYTCKRSNMMRNICMRNSRRSCLQATVLHRDIRLQSHDAQEYRTVCHGP